MTNLSGAIVCFTLFTALNGANVNEKAKFSNLWVANIEGGERVAQRVARDLGFTYKGQCGQIIDYYELVKEDHPKESTQSNDYHTRNLLNYDEVKWASQQMLVNLMSPERQSLFENEERNVIKEMKISKRGFGSNPTIKQGDISKLGKFPTLIEKEEKHPLDYKGVTRNPGQVSSKISAYAKRHNDADWTSQWQLQDYRTSDIPVMDLNVAPVHKMGYTGKGVTIAVVDTGIYKNPDLLPNLDLTQSYDFCNSQPGCEPSGDSHGTRSAGVMAMVADNSICGVGIAYKAKIVGLKNACSSDIVVSQIARANTHNLKSIDIYSNSWSYDTRNVKIHFLDKVNVAAYKQGVTEGRGGRGAIYVHPAGGEKDVYENCAIDAYINQAYVIAIAAANQWGKTTHYSERCTAIMATAYSNDAYGEGIMTTDNESLCIKNFGGTTAASSQAAAIIALVLDVKEKLSYRDVMHLIVMSAEPAPLADNKHTWYRNGRGFWVSNDFGFGLMNAENMAHLAKKWKNVPVLSICTVNIKPEAPVYFDSDQSAKLHFFAHACEGLKDEVNFLEHVEVTATATFPFRGYVAIDLLSPSKTRSQLLEMRPKDLDDTGEMNWTFMTTHNWGENPRGDWTLEYKVSSRLSMMYVGTVSELTIKFYGTKEEPAHYKKDRIYAPFRLPDETTSFMNPNHA